MLPDGAPTCPSRNRTSSYTICEERGHYNSFRCAVRVSMNPKEGAEGVQALCVS